VVEGVVVAVVCVAGTRGGEARRRTNAQLYKRTRGGGLTPAVLLIHEHNVTQIPVYRGSFPGRVPVLDRKR
jgi:hypothetical protein